MKQIMFLLSCLMLLGCVATVVQKEIQIRKDADGKVIETIEIERSTQQGSTKALQFDHLKNSEKDSAPAVVYH